MGVRRRRKTKKLNYAVLILVCLLFGASLGMATPEPVFADTQIDLSDDALDCRVTQRGSDDCAIASLASMEAYINELENDNQAAYNAIWNKNGQQSYIQSWTNLGYRTYALTSDFDGDIEAFCGKIYDQLAKGIPCAVRRNSSPTHYSVIVGYSGDTSSFRLEDFIIMEVNRGASGQKALKNLEEWMQISGGTELSQLVIRQSGIGEITEDDQNSEDQNNQNNQGNQNDQGSQIPDGESRITVSGQTYPGTFHPLGGFCAIKGTITSGKPLASVTASVYTSSGKAALTQTATPNAKTYDLKGVDNAMAISDLGTGSYVYSVKATDSAGHTETLINASFAVVEGMSPAAGSIGSQGSGTLITLQINNPVMYINGVANQIDSGGTTPMIQNDRTILPVRAVTETMGATVTWNEVQQIVTLTLNGKELYLQISNGQAWDSEGIYHKLGSPPVIVNGRTMLPIRFVVEYFGGSVQWSESAQMVAIAYNTKASTN